ncbi:hypothetical protein NUACC21_57860 [Scytonema sp. NUACC21]
MVRILLVEDDPDWQNILKDLIENACNNIRDQISDQQDIIKSVKTFTEARTMLQNSDWHLLVTDIGLIDSSHSNKDKLGKHLVEFARKKNIPTIVVSGTPVISTKDVRNLLKEHSIVDYFSKRDCDGQKFVSTVEQVLQQQLQSSPNSDRYLRKDSNIKILFLASEPTDAPRLRLGQELRDIKETLRLSKNRDKFRLEERTSVRLQDITQAILDFEPQIVHFSGHGTNTGELCFEDSSGNMKSVSAEDLGNIFKCFEEKILIKCVILNACHSIILVKDIVKYVPFAIGISEEIIDSAAIKFVTGFYRALGSGANFTIPDAYNLGCAEMGAGMDKTSTNNKPVPVLCLGTSKE